MTLGELLLLLAVAVSQVDLSLSTQSVSLNITSCPITFYGHKSTWINATIVANSLSICFGNSSGTTPDCLLLDDAGGSRSVTASIRFTSSTPSGFSSKSHCFVPVETKNTVSTNILKFNIYNMGTQAAILTLAYSSAAAANYNFSVQVDGSSVDSWSYTAAEAKKYPTKDLSGCRVSGVIFLPGSVIGSADCGNLTCDDSAVIRTVTSCASTETCGGNNTCLPVTFVCTVTGSTVIDFHGRVQSVQDRCTYKLMVHSTQNFELSAGFRERRRQDVSFLDHLILLAGGTTVVLERGGGVLVNDQAVTLSATAQLLAGVELSKDNSGVTAKMPDSNMTLFFDGNIAQLSGFAENVSGLCGNPTDSSLNTTLDQEINTNYSAPGCDVQYNDTVNSSINCKSSTEHCNLLMQAPFTVCHNEINPEPYITACTNTLCNYLMVDGLKCQFFEAYAKACSLKNITMERWRSTRGCPALPQPFCLDQYCSDHEFCGEKLDGGTRCLCRALFAAKYKPTNALGEPTVCMHNSATVTLARCLLEDNGIDYSMLQLNDLNCTGHMDNQTHMVTFSFDSNDMCGTEVKMNKSHIMYKNSIMTRNSTSIITRHDRVQLDISCLYTIPDVESMSFRIRDSSVVQQIISGVWNYTLTMSAYSDAGRTNLITQSTEIQLNQKVWMEMKTEGLDGDMATIVTDSCWATSQSSPDSSPRHDLIINKCPSPADQTVNVVGNGLGTSNYFSLNTFQFSGETGDVYLHCQVELCPTQGQSCAPSCGGVRKRRSVRSKYVGGSSALITMAWSP